MAIINVNAGDNLQTALNSALPGDTVRIDPAGTFTAGYTLPVTDANATALITVESMADASNFPNAFSRVNPTSHAAFMPKIQGPGSNTSPLAAGNNTHHWLFRFIDFQTTLSVSSIVEFGTSGSPQTSLAVVPHHMHMDRCIVRQMSTSVDVGRGLFLNSQYSDITNNWIGGIKKAGQDAQAIICINGPGDYLIQNNYLEATGECIMFGGGDPGIAGLNPQNVIFRRNYLYKPLSWKPLGATWNIKNLYEMKVGKYFTVEDNYMENVWHGEQQGVAIVLKSTNQDGGHTAAETAFVTVRRNIVRTMGGAINVAGNPEQYSAVKAHDLTFENNLFYDITTDHGWGRTVQISQVNNAHFRHNTFVGITGKIHSVIFFSEVPNVDILQGFVYTDNYGGERGDYGVKGSASGEGNAAIADYTQSPQFLRNIIVAAPSGSYPTGNNYPAAISNVGFVDYGAKNYRLASNSPYKGAGANGKDIGVDHDLLSDANAAVAGNYSSDPGGGTPTTTAYVGYLDSPTALGNQTYTVPGMSGKTGKLVLLFGANHGLGGSDQDDHHKFFGAAVSAAKQHGWGIEPLHGIAAGSDNHCVVAQSNTHCVYVPDAGGTRIIDAQFVSWGANGQFTLNWTDVWNTPIRLFYLVVSGDDFQADLGTAQARTTNGLQQVTSLAWQPELLCTHAGLGNATMNFSQANHAASGGIGFATGPAAQHFSGWRSNTVASPHRATTYQRTDRILSYPNAPAAAAPFREASLNAFLANGFELNWTTTNATAAWYMWIAMKGGPFSIGSFTATPGAGDNQSITSPGNRPSAVFLQSANRAASTQAENHFRTSWGVADGSAMWSIWGGDRDNVATTIAATRSDTNRVLRLGAENNTGPSIDTDLLIDTLTRTATGFDVHYLTKVTTGQQILFVTFGTEAAPTPPSTPTSPSPANSATGVSTVPALTWSATGATTYDVKFGTSATPPTVSSGQSTASYSTGTLALNTVYYWQIVAINSGGSTTGPVWSFTTTASGPSSNTPLVVNAADWDLLGNTTTPVNFPFEVPAGTDRALLVGFAVGQAVNTVTFDGVALTRIDFNLQPGDLRKEWWLLINPPVGTFNIGVTMSGESIFKAGALALTNVHQTVPYRNTVKTGGDSNTMSTTVSSFASDLVINGLAVENASPVTTFTAGAGQTVRYNAKAANHSRHIAASSKVGDANVVSTWTVADSSLRKWAAIGFSVQPATVSSPPSAPTSPSPADTATGISLNPTLAWSAPDATSYDVRFGTSATPPLASSGQSAATYAPSTLANSTTYYWQIVAINADGSTTGSVWSFTTAAAPVVPPGNPSSPSPAHVATGVGINPTLTWTSSGATSYNVRFGTSPTPPVVSSGQVPANYEPATLAYSTQYYWQIEAINADGTTTGSVWSFTTTAVPVPPGAPSSPSPAHAATGVSITPTLTWASTGATGYDVRFGTSPTPPIVSSGQSAASYTPPTLANSTTYYWQIVAINADGSTTGSVWSFTTVSGGTGGTAPSAPSSPNPADTATAVVINPTLTWAAAGATSYNVRFGTTASPPLVSSGQAIASYTPATLNYGTTYYWRIDAINASGTTIGSVWSFTTTSTPTPPSAPTSPNPAHAATGVSIIPTLTWAAPGATSYNVRFGTATNPPLVTSGIASASYTPGTLAYNTTYYWQIEAINDDGTTVGSTWSFTTAGAPPSAPNTPSPVHIATGVSVTPTLTWVASGATTYDVRFGTSPSPPLVSNGIAVASYTPSTLAYGAVYYWQIDAINANGTTPGPVWSFTTAAAPSDPKPPDAPLSGFFLRVSTVILSSSVAAQTVITTETPHGFLTGDSVTFRNHVGSTPAINGTYTATRLTATTFRIPVNVTVAGTGGRATGPRKALVESFRMSESANDRKTLEATIVGANNDFRPGLDAEVELYENTELIYGGVIDQPSESSFGPSDIRTSIHSVDYSTFAENVMFTGVLLNGTLKQQLQQLIPLITASPYNIVLDPAQPTGPTMNPKVYNFRFLKDIIDELMVDSGGYLPRWGADRTFGMFLPSFGVIDAPFSLVENDGRHLGDIEVSQSRDNYANRVWMKCGSAAGAETERLQTAAMPAGNTGGGLTRFDLAQQGISYSEQPREIAVSGSTTAAHNGMKPIGAPGTKNGSDSWEWIWQWNGYAVPTLIHNDAEFGALPNGTFLSLSSKGVAYWNTRVHSWTGTLIMSVSDNYRWYWVPAPSDSFTPRPHTIYINRTLLEVGGSKEPIGEFGTINEVTNSPWNWVWNDATHSIGHHVNVTALTAADQIHLYSRQAFELIIQSPLASEEPTAEQSARGLRETMIEAPDIADPAVAQSLGNQYLIQKLIRPKTVKYKTLSGVGTGRLRPGQVQTITMSSRNVNGEFLITELQTSLFGGLFPKRDVTAVDSSYWQGSWRDTYRKWGGTTGSGTSSGSSAGSVSGSGGGRSQGGSVYLLATGVESVRSATPTWVSATAGRIRVRIDTVARGSLNATVVAQIRLAEAGAGSVKARLFNVSDNTPATGESIVHASMNWGTVAFSVGLSPGTKMYELQLLPGIANRDVQASGYLE